MEGVFEDLDDRFVLIAWMIFLAEIMDTVVMSHAGSDVIQVPS